MSPTDTIADQIEGWFNDTKLPDHALKTIEEVIAALDEGRLTVVDKIDGQWQVNAWVKKAILLYFRLKPIEKMEDGKFQDKIPLKHNWADNNRIVPYSSARRGSYIAPGVIIMAPSFINIGGYIDSGSMVDSLVLVGSCARIGKNVHLGAGTIIGGVLEPPGGLPVIIEDNAFIGGSCGIYEGCLVEENAVIAAGTIITAGTPIIDLESGKEYYGRVPKNSVVVPGGRKKIVGSTEIVLQTPVIIKRRDPSVSAKVALEDSLR